MELKFNLNVFEGPLDLLMHLIEKNKIDIYDIPIGLLTDQYMECIKNMEDDMDSDSEFIVMASNLLYLKARSLLPKDDEEEEEENPEEELVKRLIEYKMFKEVSKVLDTWQENSEGSVYRSEHLPEEVKAYKEPADLDELLNGVDKKRLYNVFEMLIKKQEQIKDPIRSEFKNIKKEPLNVKERISYIKNMLLNDGEIWFSSVISGGTRFEIVVTFLAVLELIKSGQIVITQEERFCDICLKATEEIFKEDEYSSISEY